MTSGQQNVEFQKLYLHRGWNNVIPFNNFVINSLNSEPILYFIEFMKVLNSYRVGTDKYIPSLL